MTHNKKELLDIFARITGVTPLSTSALKNDCIHFRVPNNNKRMRAFIAKLGPDEAGGKFCGILIFPRPRVLMHDVAFSIPISRLIKAGETLPPCEQPEEPLDLNGAYKKGKLDGLLKAESIIRNLSVRDLTNIMRGEKEDRARLYGMKEALRVLTERIEAMKKIL